MCTRIRLGVEFALIEPDAPRADGSCRHAGAVLDHVPRGTEAQDQRSRRKNEKFKQEIQVAETLQKMDFTSEYQPRNEEVNDGVMLATSVLLESFEEKASTLDMPCIEGMSVRMNLTQELNFGVK